MLQLESHNQTYGPIIWICSGGSDGWGAPDDVRKDLTNRGILCWGCQRICRENADGFESLVVRYKPRHLPIGSASGIREGTIVSRELLGLLGSSFAEGCFVVPLLFEKSGNRRELPEYAFIFAKERKGIFRGSATASMAMCKACNSVGDSKLPVLGASRRVLLRRYWDGSGGATLIGGQVLTTAPFYERAIKPASIKNLEPEETGFWADEPMDGYPAEYSELVAEVRSQRRFSCGY